MIRFACDSPLEGDGFEPSVPVAREPVYIAEGELRGDRRAAKKISRGTDGSNPSPSSEESANYRFRCVGNRRERACTRSPSGQPLRPFRRRVDRPGELRFYPVRKRCRLCGVIVSTVKWLRSRRMIGRGGIRRARRAAASGSAIFWILSLARGAVALKPGPLTRRGGAPSGSPCRSRSCSEQW
jgi:hypothetical protein